jgi:hypothetical protein
MSRIEATTLVKRNESILVSKIDNEIVMLDLDQGKYFSLAKVGADIWNLIESPISVMSICTALQKKYDIDEETCICETTEFIEKLIKKSILTLCEPSYS